MTYGFSLSFFLYGSVCGMSDIEEDHIMDGKAGRRNAKLSFRRRRSARWAPRIPTWIDVPNDGRFPDVRPRNTFILDTTSFSYKKTADLMMPPDYPDDDCSYLTDLLQVFPIQKR